MSCYTTILPVRALTGRYRRPGSSQPTASFVTCCAAILYIDYHQGEKFRYRQPPLEIQTTSRSPLYNRLSRLRPEFKVDNQVFDRHPTTKIAGLVLGIVGAVLYKGYVDCDPSQLQRVVITRHFDFYLDEDLLVIRLLHNSYWGVLHLLVPIMLALVMSICRSHPL